jgi:5-methylcytosine-specific restriction endonuclease McrA
MNRRQQGEELWRQKFNEFGLSEHFEFIGRDWESDHGGLALVRCKSCNHEFKTWNIKAYFRGRLKTFWCPECGMKSDGDVQWTKSAVCDEAMTFYLQGHSKKEIADKFGISATQFDNERRRRGIKKTQEQRKESWRKSIFKARAKGNEAQKERARQKRVAHLDELGFDLIGDNVAKCRKCGCEFERGAQHLSKGNVICPDCAEAASLEHKRIQREQAEAKKIENHKAKLLKNPRGLSYYQLSIQNKLDVIHVCEFCGKQYTIRERIQAGEIKTCQDSGCCSKACAKKRSRRKLRKSGFPKNHLHRAHKYGCAYESGITLEKLIKRDGLRCGICGEMCDPNDHSWTEYFGPMYPTIDHIIPMSKGGGHTWDNVQVAHAICNSNKRDTVEEVSAYDAS